MDILAGLNPQQRLAVEHGRGPALVLAGAGSGKTRVITHRIAYLIRNSAARPENILAVTFTNKAAQEMRGRVQKIVGPSRSAEPLISTFHSFCVRLLRREIHHLGYRRDFSIYDTEDQKRLVKRILQESRGTALEIPPREIIGRISYAKNHNISPERYAARFPSDEAEDLQRIYAQYNARLRNSNSLDFDDLLLMAAAVMAKNPELRNHYSDRYRYILVDEYQDTNRPQYELLRLLTSAHKNLFVVGDEDQSIYKFRGADIQNILKFEKDFPGARLIKLEQNYRSSRNILRVAGAVVENNTERKGKTLWTENATGDVVTCRSAESPREEAVYVAGQIKNILEENPHWHVAVLYRANFLSRNFEDILTEEGMPYAVVGSVAFFARMEIKDLLAYLRILFNPEDDVALLRIINTPARGIGSTTIDLLTESALVQNAPILQIVREKVSDPQLPGRITRNLRQFLALTDKWTSLRDSIPMARLIETIMEDIHYGEMLQKQESAAEAENRLANLEELMRAAAESEERGESISDFLDRASLSSELDHLDPNTRIALMTLHSAKGLEFDAVFLAGMEEGLFPHSQSMNSKEEIEEERRLCYVGITRARQKLFVTWTPYRKTYGPDAGFAAQMSRFLREMPEVLVEGLDSHDFDFIDQRPRYRNRFHEDAESCGSHPGRRMDRSPARMDADLKPKSIAELKAYLVQQKQLSPEKAGPAAAAGAGLRTGMRVRHDQFGDGIILSRERVGNDFKLVVTFSRVGKKSLMEKFAKLKSLSFGKPPS